MRVARCGTSWACGSVLAAATLLVREAPRGVHGIEPGGRKRKCDGEVRRGSDEKGDEEGENTDSPQESRSPGQARLATCTRQGASGVETAPSACQRVERTAPRERRLQEKDKLSKCECKGTATHQQEGDVAVGGGVRDERGVS
ncbi:hypothetical protein DFH06DRAFT_1189192, partial [Mycena polygramma]